MSTLATIWAGQQVTDRPADKLVLWAMADAAREEMLCFTSIAAVAEFTGLDRKTIIAAQARLKDRLIVDTGERRGATRQIIVWRLLVPPNADAAAAELVRPSARHYVYRLDHPATGEFYYGVRSCDVSPDLDHYGGSGKWPRQMLARGQTLEKTIIREHASRSAAEDDEARCIAEGIASPLCRNIAKGAEKGIPKTAPLARKGPVFPTKQSHKRDPEPVLEPDQPSEASPPSVAGKRESKRDRAHKLPEDWQPEPFPVGTVAASAAEVWPPGMMERELAKFRDYWRGNGKRMVDWQATWRNWVVRADEQRHRNRDRGAGRRSNGLLDAVLDAEHHDRP